MPENTKPRKAPTIDLKAWQRNKTTAWLEFVDRLSSWLWQDNEGAGRWTLVLDDAERHVSTTYPSRNAAGLKMQVLHQSRLKHALVTAFGSIYKTIINAHPNTEALDVSGSVVPFGTNLLRAIGAKIVPEDAEGVTHANLELQRQIYTFPGWYGASSPCGDGATASCSCSTTSDVFVTQTRTRPCVPSSNFC